MSKKKPSLDDVSAEIGEQRQALLLLAKTLPDMGQDLDQLDQLEQAALRSLLEVVGAALAAIEAKIDGDSSDGL